MSELKGDGEIAQKGSRGEKAALPCRAVRCCVFTLQAGCRSQARSEGPTVRLLAPRHQALPSATTAFRLCHFCVFCWLSRRQGSLERGDVCSLVEHERSRC